MFERVSTLFTSVGFDRPVRSSPSNVVMGLPAELRGRREQPVQVRRKPTRQRLVALDHLEHRLLLAEQVLVRAGHDGDLAVATDACGLELLYGAGDRLDLAPEARLQADERLGGSDRERGDRHALDELVRVGPQQRTVLERARLALGAVADQIPRPPVCAATPAHFWPVGNPPPPRPRNPDRDTTSIVAAGPSSWARRTPDPPMSLARYASSDTTGSVGNKNVLICGSSRRNDRARHITSSPRHGSQASTSPRRSQRHG
jgi:hypothetical protein